MSTQGRTRRQRSPLSRRQVVTEALAVVDAEGVEALTMRKLADRLGVYPTAVYWHTGNKADLVAAVCEHVLADLTLPPVNGGPGWQDWLRDMARATRGTLRAHPNIVPVMASQLQVATTSFALAERLLEVLHAAGFRGPGLRTAYNTVIGSIFGFMFVELSAEPTGADPDWKDTFRRRLDATSPDATPVLAAHLPLLAGQAFMLRWDSGSTQPMDDSFATAVEVLVGGLAAVLDRG